MKNFWLVDVKSTIDVDGNLVAFDYINTYHRYTEALEVGRKLSKDPQIVCISIHRWIVNADGSQEHAETTYGHPDIPWEFININHPENQKYCKADKQRRRR